MPGAGMAPILVFFHDQEKVNFTHYLKYIFRQMKEVISNSASETFKIVQATEIKTKN